MFKPETGKKGKKSSFCLECLLKSQQAAPARVAATLL